ncbi:hypothetical protein ACFLUA_04840 [Chloroflexota bacterium]
MGSEKLIQPKTKVLRKGNAFLIIFFVIVILLSTVGLILTLWPVQTYNNLPFSGLLSPEFRNLLLAISAGILGSSVEALVTLEQTASNRKSFTSWQTQLYLRTLVTFPLSIAFYLIIRGVVLSPNASVMSLNPYGIAIVFFFVGLFSGSIFDRLSAIAKALFPQESQVEGQLSNISSALGLTTFDNYNGFICLSIMDTENEEIELSKDGELILRANGYYELVVWFQPDEPEQEPYEEISITEGMDTQKVEFQLISDSDGVKVLPQRKTITFVPEEPSSQVVFQFRTPEVAELYEIWIQVLQKNRLIEVISAVFQVHQSDY